MKTAENFETEAEALFLNQQAVAKDLRKKFIEQTRHLSQLRTWRSVLALATDWAVIVGVASACELWFNPLSYFLAIAIIAGRQHGFFVLIHEATHFRLSNSAKINDLLSDYFAAIPVFFDTHMYRMNHSKHHRFLNSEEDPDWVRKQGRPEWKFPIRKDYIAKTYPKFLLFRGAVEWMTISLIFSGVLPLKTMLTGYQRRLVLKRFVYYAVAAALLTYTQLWTAFAMYWVVPLLFVFPSFQRVRSVAEHFGLKREHELNSSRNILAPWYETLFFAPHNVNYHLVHHMFPAVPFYNLKKLNTLLMEDADYRRLAHQNTSYIALSAYALTKDLLVQKTEGLPSDVKEAA